MGLMSLALLLLLLPGIAFAHVSCSPCVRQIEQQTGQKLGLPLCRIPLYVPVSQYYIARRSMCLRLTPP